MTSMMSLINYTERNYTRRNCKVAEVNCIEVIAVDPQGHKWNFTADNLQVGDTVALIMHDNYTTNDITDDIVTGVK